MKKYPYVLVSIYGKKMYYPYPEVQEFTIYDLSDSVIYLTDEELYEKEKELYDESKK